MKRGEIIPQVDDCVRYLYECPRGTVAIDEYRDGTREIVRCLGGSDITRRDIREALALHNEDIEEERREEQERQSDYEHRMESRQHGTD
jgi:hypothetical protein